jgi:hypothetical protein
MFVKSKNYESCIQRVRINVGTLVGLKEDDEAFITLKELPTIDMLRLKEAAEKGEKESLSFFKEILPSIIADHNFYETEQKRMDGIALTTLIFESLDLTLKVINEYTRSAFFTRARRTGDRSPASALKSSTEDTAPSSSGSIDAGSST